MSTSGASLSVCSGRAVTWGPPKTESTLGRTFFAAFTTSTAGQYVSVDVVTPTISAFVLESSDSSCCWVGLVIWRSSTVTSYWFCSRTAAR